MALIVGVFRRFFLSFGFATALLVAGCGGGGGGGGGGADGGGAGTKEDPATLTYPNSFPHAASIPLESGGRYYKVIKLEPGRQYTITLTSNQSVSLWVTADQAMTQPLCFVSSKCLVSAPDNGELYMQVMFTAVEPNGASYTLGIEPANSEGSQDSPVDLTGRLPYQGTASARVYSYYVVHGLTPGVAYRVDTTTSSGATKQVYQDQFVNGFCCDFTAASDTVWIRVRGGSSDGTFTLNVVETGAPAKTFSAEGAPGAEIGLTFSEPHSGETNQTGSFYHVSGLAPGKQYRVAVVKSTTDPLGLAVYDDSAYSAPICTDETLASGGMYDCVVSPSSSGELWIKVDGSYAYRYLGGTYSVGVYAYFPNEGTSLEDKPLQYAAAIPYSGTVDSLSEYLLSGLEPNTTYIATVTDYDASAAMSFTLARASNWAAGCASKETAPGTLSCSLLSHEQGTLAIDVREGNLVLGSPFVLDVVRSAYQSEGTADSPVPVPLTLESYDGQVGRSNSYYEITGLTPGQAYTVSLTGLEEQRFYVYDDAAKVGGTGGSAYACSGYASRAQCTARAVGTSLWLMVAHDFTPTGYTIATVAVPYRAEGSLDQPVPLTYQIPTEGMVDIGESYYRLDGLEPGKTYVVTATGIGTDGSAYMYVYDNPVAFGSTGYGEYACWRSLPNGGQTYCTAAAASSSLWIMVSGPASGTGAVYILSSDEAKAAENKTLDYAGGDFPYAGTTDNVSSRYTVVVKPNQHYQVSLTNMSADFDLHLDGSSFACNPALGTADEMCEFTTSYSGDLSITVDGDKTLYGGSFTLGVTAGAENQGTISDPVVLDAQTQLPYNGEVSMGDSYYRIEGLLPDTFYAVSMANLTDDADLSLYENDTFSGAVCTSSQTGSAAEVCGATSSALGELWVRVDGLVPTGATFTLDADVGPTPEGAKGSEVSIASTALPYSASVDRTKSYYAITGLGSNSAYTFRFTDLTGDLTIRGYRDGSYSPSACYASGSAGNTLDCNLTTNPGGNQTVYLEVDGSGSSAGSTYTISLAP